MEKMRSIEVDIDVHKRIELERKGFEESANQVLRRLLGIDALGPAGRGEGRSWSGKGVTLPHGTLVRMQYNGTSYSGRIDDGEWLVEGARFKSPSAAASGVAKTRSGTSPSLDGWLYWQVKRPGGIKWITLEALREEARQVMRAELLS